MSLGYLPESSASWLGQPGKEGFSFGWRIGLADVPASTVDQPSLA
ncbi:hypothetical protein [Symbiopectobacterium purcellii]